MSVLGNGYLVVGKDCFMAELRDGGMCAKQDMFMCWQMPIPQLD